MPTREKNLNLLLGFKVNEQQAKQAEDRVKKITEGVQVRAAFPADLFRGVEEQAKRQGIKIGKTLDQFMAEGLSEDKAVEAYNDQLFKLAILHGEFMEEVEERSQALRKEAANLTRVSERLNQYGRGLTVLGGILTGAVLASANSYVKAAGQSEEISERWLLTSRELAESQKRIGRVSAEIVLPIYEKIAAVLERVAAFTERNPQAVQALFGTGIAFSLIGLLTLAVSKGIRVIADIKLIAASNQQFLAATIMQSAAKDQLIAAGLVKQGAITSVISKGATFLGGASIATIASTVASILAALAGGTALGAIVNDILAKSGAPGFIRSNTFATGAAYEVGKNIFGPLSGNDPEEIERKSLVFAALVGRVTGAIDESSPLWIKAAESAEITVQKLNQIAGSLNEGQIVEAYKDMIDRETEITKQAAKKRESILEEFNDRIALAGSRNLQAISNIISRSREQTASITRNYLRSEEADFENYQRSRAKLIEDSNLQIQQIEQRHQESLRRMRLDHQDRVAELVAARDALGLVKEQRRFERERSESERATNLEIAERNRELGRRLQEMAKEFAIQREQRLADFQERLAEVRAQREEALKEQRAHYQEELKQLRAAKDEQLRQLDQATREEISRNQQAFINKIKQLDSSLLAEQQLRGAYYQKMLADAEKFLEAYRKSLPTADEIPGRASGGYASGIIRTGEVGREFVLSHQTTRAAEQIIGGSLNQENLLRAMSPKQIVVNDYRRFEKAPSTWEREEMNQEMVRLIEGVISE